MINEPFDPKLFKKKRACVIGLGRSGQAAAKLLLKKGFPVFGTDTRPRTEVKQALGRLAARMKWEGGGHSEKALRCAFAVKSPGLPPSAPILGELKSAGIPIFSEIEVALAFCKSREIIAITGTNGKTTTAALAGAVFNARVCGNIGVPLSEIVELIGPKDPVVLEVSSYQLEDSRFFHAKAAAILNITADHIDHHGTMAAYIEAKARIFKDQEPGDACVFNAGDPLTYKLSRRCPSQRLYFGPAAAGTHAWVENGKIHIRLPGSRKTIVLDPPKLPGGHNLENAMAAALLGLSRGIRLPALKKAFKAFKGVEHRLEETPSVRGLRCINDSKATNVDSTLVALKSLPEADKNILLILGGLHKGSPYAPLRPLIEKGVKAVLSIGSAARKIEEDLGGAIHIFPCGDLSTAIDTALKIGAKGDILLLSPACASFDQFKNFEDRGRQFKELLEKKR